MPKYTISKRDSRTHHLPAQAKSAKDAVEQIAALHGPGEYIATDSDSRQTEWIAFTAHEQLKVRARDPRDD